MSDIYLGTTPTEERINALRQLLTNTQGKAVEATDGFMPRSERAEIRAQRQAWRNELRDLERGLEPEADLKDLRNDKLAVVTVACQQVIHEGIEIDGLRFSLTEHDQIEILGQMKAVREGAEYVPYHADGELCRMFPASEFMKVADAAMQHIFFHRTYANHLNVWIRRASADELVGIFYGVELPADLQESFALLLEKASQANAR